MNDEQQHNDHYKNPPIKRLPIKDPDIQLVGGGKSTPGSRPPSSPIIIASEHKPPWYRHLADNLMSLSIMAVIILGLAYFLLSLGSYYDPFAMCRIRIHADLVTGNKKTINQALRLLKKQDRASYDLTCQYVNHIYERTCIGADWHLDNTQPGSEEAGCYVKGSKSIYIKPNFNKNNQVIISRKDSIKKYSQLSQEYWNN